ncbi:hypothetical protein CLV89_104262 [Tritonibacter scottomollicae]|uniref:Uncharacterized protein n=1 Tax=Tritonibacter scottomollicae TaxID=483013 RepID=A0A2T1AIK4_TRISK|nr:hypothetical protein CLV89_104262 [Tritonibacter scottomollicae]
MSLCKFFVPPTVLTCCDSVLIGRESMSHMS